MEKFNFKVAYAIALIVQLINAIVTPFIIELCPVDYKNLKRFWYTYSVCMSLITNNCHYIFFPVILSKMYGTHGGLLAYSVGFTFVSISTLTNTILVQFFYCTCKLGFKGLSWIYSGFLGVSLFILLFLYKGSKT